MTIATYENKAFEVSEVNEIAMLDWELPSVTDSEDFENFTSDEKWDWMEELVESFENHNFVILSGGALRYFRESAIDFYIA